MIKLAVNGFGRIGRAAFKIAVERPDLEIVAINDLMSPKVLAHLLQYDSVFGKFQQPVTSDDKHIIVNGKEFLVVSEKEPEKLPWKDLAVDVVLECTGRMTQAEEAKKHITAGAKRVIISAPAKGDDVMTFLMGVNTDDYQKQEVVSNASCTTNSLGPVVEIMQRMFGIDKMMMTTIHSYTTEQNLVDGPSPALHNDMRRARAAAINIVPTSTGAATATTKVIPELLGKFDGLAIRVPTPCGSLSDITMVLKKPATKEEINRAFANEAQTPRYSGILSYTNLPLVSSDIIGLPFSAIVDGSLTQVVEGTLAKVVAWYDNEWGYANRLVELAVLIGASL